MLVDEDDELKGKIRNIINPLIESLVTTITENIKRESQEEVRKITERIEIEREIERQRKMREEEKPPDGYIKMKISDIFNKVEIPEKRNELMTAIVNFIRNNIELWFKIENVPEKGFETESSTDHFYVLSKEGEELNIFNHHIQDNH